MSRLPEILFGILLGVAIAVAGMLGGCKRSPSPPPPSPTVDTLVVCVGGWGADQTGPIAEAIRANPRTIVIQPSTWDSYKVDVRPIFAAYTVKHRVLILHSFAAFWVTQPLPPVDYVVLLDPVSPGGTPGSSFWGSLPAPAYARSVDWFRRTDWFGPARADIAGLTPITVAGGHNDIPRDPAVIAAVTTRIEGLK